jgi:DNA repair/transcription protein MET18/MMS19
MGEVSLVGIVDLMTGEKDPRNLMMVFSILKVVMMEWDITNHVEVCSLSLQLYHSFLIGVVAL